GKARGGIAGGDDGDGAHASSPRKGSARSGLRGGDDSRRRRTLLAFYTDGLEPARRECSSSTRAARRPVFAGRRQRRARAHIDALSEWRRAEWVERAARVDGRAT